MREDINELSAVSTVHENVEAAEKRARAEAIADRGSFELSLEGFAEAPGLLEEMVALLRERERGIVEAMPNLSEHDWQVLTILELFDAPTFEHCKRTFYLAKDKLARGGEVGETLSYLLSEEGISIEDVLRACLLHDCGKMCLDHRILRDTHTDDEWAESYKRYAETDAGKALGATIGDIDEYLAAHPGMRPVHVVPFEASFDPESNDDMAALAVMRSKGLDTSLTLAELIAPHQDRSGEILRHGDVNDPAADLVENHHPRQGEHGERAVSEEKYPSGVSLLRTSIESSEGMSQILRIADVYDAYHSAREYKPGHPMYATLAHILREADRGVISGEIAQIWVRDSLSDISQRYEGSFSATQKQKERDHADEEWESAFAKMIAEEHAGEKFLRERGMFDHDAPPHLSP